MVLINLKIILKYEVRHVFVSKILQRQATPCLYHLQ